jgi:hypothetical protein
MVLMSNGLVMMINGRIDSGLSRFNQKSVDGCGLCRSGRAERVPTVYIPPAIILTPAIMMGR